MARVRLLQPWNGQPAGAVVEIPGGQASVIIPRRLAELTTDPVTDAPAASEPPKKPKTSRAKKTK